MKILKFKLVRNILYCVLSVINFVIPKSKYKIFMFDKELIAFNEIALFKYMNSNGYLEKNSIVYYTQKMAEARKKYCNITNVIFTNSIVKALWARLRAKYCFAELIGYILACTPSRGQICVSLWHGMALKRIGFHNSHDILRKSFSYMLCYSDFAAEIMKKDWCFDESKVLISQNPRNDFMFTKHDCFSEFHIPKNRKNILWLPTFRNTNSDNYHDSNIDFPLVDSDTIYKLDAYLQKHNINMIIKLHPLQRNVHFLNKTYNNIFVIETKDFHATTCEFYEFIGQADALLSDYSSVAIDFMLLDRPIGYVIDDIDEYKSNRGFHVVDPIKFMPGHHITTLDELLAFLDDIGQNKDPYRKDRHRINNIINQYHDKNNCKRVIDIVGIGKE